MKLNEPIYYLDYKEAYSNLEYYIKQNLFFAISDQTLNDLELSQSERIRRNIFSALDCSKGKVISLSTEDIEQMPKNIFPACAAGITLYELACVYWVDHYVKPDETLFITRSPSLAIQANKILGEDSIRLVRVE